ncbi:MAG: efflux RND transporter periplasmic adaptor subunit [Deltaproteobacteria bacterium]|jgi:RND family efflux transporter MFP subunit|nr:efflux RND transporter periplasmic adaptor subunit [Deltaproteobacteria bacterium]MBW2479206.1 efflux RND transporter periplasmic adaptor subunit [Deltaproteobacteria bacterium]
MSDPASKIQPNESHSGDGPRPRRRFFINIFLSLIVIVAGIAGAVYITKSAPKARKRPPKPMTPLVQVVAVAPGDYAVTVSAMGTVIPAREITLEARVAGEIVAMHPNFTVGGFLEKDSEILRIDPQDYQLALTLAEARVKDAESKLKLLEAEAASAREEWRQLYRDRDQVDNEPPPLVFKQPQLSAAKAKLTAEKADVRKAQLDLSRTRISAPFNAIVRTKHVDIGSQVSGQEKLAELVGTDEYWIQASIPVDRLDWMMIPRRPGDPGANVRILHRNGYEINGTVIRLLGDLGSEGRMARILVEVKDPLNFKKDIKDQPALLIGEYVRIEIQGRELQNVFRIPRNALRDNSMIWIVNKDSNLDTRRVDTLWRDTKTVLLRQGLEPGDQLIVSDLPAPINGMPVQVEKEDR